MDLEEWQALIDHWRAKDGDIRFLDIPPDVADNLGLQLPQEPINRQETRMTDEELSETSGDTEGRLKKKKYFDGTQCAFKKCTRKAVGYVTAVRPTKGHPVGRLWFAPACDKCPNHPPMTLAELAYQRNGASDLAMVLDIEVGDLLKRLEEAGIDEHGRKLGEPEVLPPGQETPQAAPEAPQQAELPHTAAPGDNGAQDSLMVVVSEQVPVPTQALGSSIAETNGVLAFLATFHIVDQPTMDAAAGWLKEVKTKWKDLDEMRKALGAPLRAKLEEIQGHFNPALQALKKAETTLKQKITEGSARAEQARQQALLAAQQAHQQGNIQATAIASQQAAYADVALPQGISQRTVIRFKVVDPSQLPSWAWSPDPAKIQAAIDQGWTEIPGVQMWEEPIVSART